MSKFLVAGIVQRETIVKVEKIPIAYETVTSSPFTIHMSVGGDAYNEALALKWLGNSVDFMTMIGRYESPGLLNPKDSEVKLYTDYVLPVLAETPTAVVFCDDTRRHQIFEDVKDERENIFDVKLFESRVNAANMVLLANANFCRSLIPIAKKAGKPIAVNIRNYRDETVSFNEEFLEAADILYLSDDNLNCDPYDFVKGIVDRHHTGTVVLGQGNKGVLLYSREEEIFAHFNTVKTNTIVNTVGAGNALFSCFLHYLCKTGRSVEAIKNALLFASYKIGFIGTSNGFMTEEQIEQWHGLIWKDNKVLR